jgi:putative phosphoribosyl transferase
MIFKNRTDAGNRLSQALVEDCGDCNPLILGIPRGGIEVGYQVAKNLKADFSILIVRKLPFPDNPWSLVFH